MKIPLPQSHFSYISQSAFSQKHQVKLSPNLRKSVTDKLQASFQLKCDKSTKKSSVEFSEFSLLSCHSPGWGVFAFTQFFLSLSSLFCCRHTHNQTHTKFFWWKSIKHTTWGNSSSLSFEGLRNLSSGNFYRIWCDKPVKLGSCGDFVKEVEVSDKTDCFTEGVNARFTEKTFRQPF